MDPQKKLKIGWFSFTCCEDSTIVFTELLNEHFFDWKNKVEFQHFKVLKSNNKLEGLDIAFVEGAVSSSKHINEVRNIRLNCKKLVAVGSCANTGRPSANRNDFPPEVLEKYKEIFERFEYGTKVQPLKEIIQVDDSINGCPMRGEEFIAKMEGYLKEFNIMP